MTDSKFDSLKPFLRDYLTKQGYQEPTPIQDRVYEPLSAGQSLAAYSPTGSGKSLAYLVPSLNQVETNGQLQLLLLTASQDLVAQLTRLVREIVAGTGLWVQALGGSANRRRQEEGLKKKPEIAVGSLGRVNQLAASRKLKLHQVRTCVLDEADQLVQDQKTADLSQLLGRLDRKCCLAFFSASPSPALDAFIQALDREIEVYSDLDNPSFRSQLTHAYLWTPARKRTDVLRRIGHLDQAGKLGAMVFVRSRARLDQLAKQLAYHKLPLACLHSGLSSQDRQAQLARFERGEARLLLATDLASRGLDLPELQLVVQYDLAEDKEAYLHRSGRTGRMGRAGTVLSLVANKRDLANLKSQLPAGAELKPLELREGQLLAARRDPGQMHPRRRVGAARPNQAKRPIRRKDRQRRRKNKGAPRSHHKQSSQRG